MSMNMTIKREFKLEEPIYFYWYFNFQINNRNVRKDHFENGIKFDGLK